MYPDCVWSYLSVQSVTVFRNRTESDSRHLDHFHNESPCAINYPQSNNSERAELAVGAQRGPVHQVYSWQSQQRVNYPAQPTSNVSHAVWCVWAGLFSRCYSNLVWWCDWEELRMKREGRTSPRCSCSITGGTPGRCKTPWRPNTEKKKHISK